MISIHKSKVEQVWVCLPVTFDEAIQCKVLIEV